MFSCTFFKVNHVIKLLFSLLCMLVFYLTMTFAYHPLFTCYDLLVRLEDYAKQLHYCQCRLRLVPIDSQLIFASI
jgi:hypothetical protein